LLLNAPIRHSVAPEEADLRGFEHLKSLGLAGVPPKQLLYRILAGVVGVIIGLLFLFGVIVRYAGNLFPRYFPSFLATEFVVEGVVGSALIVGFGMSFISQRYRLTDFGKSLQQSAKRFYPNQTSRRRRPLLAAIPYWTMWSGLSALLVCGLPFALQAYLPAQLRTGFQPTVIISSAPAGGPAPSAVPQAPASTSQPVTTTTLTVDEIRTLIDVWRSVAGQMNEIITLTNAGEALIPNWPENVKGNAEGFSKELLRQRDSINQRRVSLQALDNAYHRYPNVTSALADVTSDGVFGRLYRALDSFAHEGQGLAKPPPENFEDTLRAYAGELKGALDNMAQSANRTRNFASRQSEELSKIEIK